MRLSGFADTPQDHRTLLHNQRQIRFSDRKTDESTVRLANRVGCLIAAFRRAAAVRPVENQADQTSSLPKMSILHTPSR